MTDPSVATHWGIGRVGVLGAGVMGAGIAAHLAGVGMPVLLLDVVPGAAARAVEAMLRTTPAAFHPVRGAHLVTPGDVHSEFAALADCDWIVEAIIERPNAKRDLFARLDGVRKPGSIVSSNTSTIRLWALTQGLGAPLAADFMVTHFFNPPHVRKVVELVAGRATRTEAIAVLRGFLAGALGETVVTCTDTPGFIVNRIDALWTASAMRHAIALGLSVEEADAVASAPFGVPQGGVFGHLDTLGIDRAEELAKSLLAALPASDAYRALFREQPVVARLIAEGRTGGGNRGGFYAADANGERCAVDLGSGDYRPARVPELESLATCGADLVALASHPDRGGRFARAVLLDTLAYAASLVPAIAGGIDAVDTAIRLGLGWQRGPFDLIDQVGPAWLVAALKAEGRAVPELLEMVGDNRFYRREDDGLLAFTPEGKWHAASRPDLGAAEADPAEHEVRLAAD
jgi:3-hydroxyacyl-CoA dehydrogenase